MKPELAFLLGIGTMLGAASFILVCILFQKMRQNNKAIREIADGIHLSVQRTQRESPKLFPGEVMYPQDSGLVWRQTEKGPDGPFCPWHQRRLYYHNLYANRDEFTDFDERFLGGSGWFLCPEDKEVFHVLDLGSVKISQLRQRAGEQLATMKRTEELH